MTEATLIVATLALPLGSAVAVALAPTARVAARVNLVGAVLTAALALALAVVAIAAAPGTAARGSWFVLDAASGVFLALVALVGLASAAVSPAYLRHAGGRSWFGERRSHVAYYVAFDLFWAVLLALPLADNLAVAWILIEASTATSALLVAFSGKRSALEAGWKYVVLTTLGLAVALLGIVVLFAAAGEGGGDLARLDWQSLARGAAGFPAQPTLLAFVLIVVGLAAKVGWAPVHNWLPDAHSEAPAPVSAMLSAALLPTVLLIAWRAELALAPALGDAVRQLFVGFGLLSLAIAIPFLWRPLPWKRLLAYSSLEHMGILALGIGFGTPLAIAGVVVHVAGHGIAKSLGFYAAIPLLRQDPAAARVAARGVARASSPTAAAMIVSLASLGGLPPSPLFVSEAMVLLGGMEAGLLAVSALAAVLLALGFLGLSHALIEGLLGERRRRERRPSPRSARAVALLGGLAAVALLALTAAAYALPGSDLVEALMRSGA